MVSRTPPPFYDEDTGLFRTDDPDLRMASYLGEDVDNPIVSFKHIENIFDDRINLLSSKLFDLKKSQGNQKNDLENFSKDIKDNFDNIENELYYKLKDMASEFFKENDKLNSENLLLQKYLTALTKDKMDLLVQINLCMNRLDQLEKYLGINIAAKRTKKSLMNTK
jgi:hypothetical protein